MESTLLKVNNVQFIITRRPLTTELEIYKNLLINYKVNLLIRIVEEPIDIHGINIVDFPEYKDGTSPDKIIIEKYKVLMINIKKKYKNPIIAIHCISSYSIGNILV